MVAAILEFYKSKTPLRTIQKLLTSSVISTCKIIIKCISLNSSIFLSMFHGFLIVEEKTKKKNNMLLNYKITELETVQDHFFLLQTHRSLNHYLMIHAMFGLNNL